MRLFGAILMEIGFWLIIIALFYRTVGSLQGWKPRFEENSGLGSTGVRVVGTSSGATGPTGPTGPTFKAN